MKRQVCEWNKVGQDTWEAKHVSAGTGNWQIADVALVEYPKTRAILWGNEKYSTEQCRQEVRQPDKREETKKETERPKMFFEFERGKKINASFGRSL